MNNTKEALKLVFKAIFALEKSQVQDSELYNDCLNLLADIIEKSK
jgi:hypothetical protein